MITLCAWEPTPVRVVNSTLIGQYFQMLSGFSFLYQDRCSSHISQCYALILRSSLGFNLFL